MFAIKGGIWRITGLKELVMVSGLATLCTQELFLHSVVAATSA